ncbi:MAG: NAD(P)H-hydrate dehydratase [Candidatus Aenigmarchaeota archaeon]|nr:NAD(P)H-hydrate dehydratase [Candidatus Aenigmarchaeota archaeon]
MDPKQLIRHIYKKRAAWSHKGQHGRLLIIGGSYLYTGSPIFNTLAAYRSGCDIVKIAAPEKAALTIRSYSPDMIAYPLKGDYLAKKHVRQIIDLQKASDAMIIGGGLGREKQTMEAVKSIIRKTTIPTVIDADALYAINFPLNKNFVLTPHTKEFYALSKRKIGNNIKQRSAAAKQLAARLDCIVLLKGHVDVIADCIHTEINKTGCPEMAKAGTGDTLAGICGAMLARHVDPFKAACVAAFINGRAGQLAAKKYGQGMKASDLAEEISNVIRRSG